MTTTGETPDRTQPDDAERQADTATQDEWDRERAQRTIAEQRRAERDAKRELAKLAQQLRDAQAKLKAREDADLSEADRLKRDLEEREEKLAELNRQIAERDQRERLHTFRDAIAEAAEKAGALHPATLYRLLDADEVDRHDDGRPKRADKVVAELRAAYPGYFRANNGAGNADAGAGRQAGVQGTSLDEWIRRSAGRPS